MIYTSYFGAFKNHNMDIIGDDASTYRENVLPVAICRYPPKGWSGVWYPKLAPSQELLAEWKNDPRNDDHFGIKRKQYEDQVLSKLDAKEVMTDLQRKIPGVEPLWESKRYHVMLLCYEKRDSFCHRHFVAQWLTKNGYPCEEV